jgi:hypothetical protein
LYKYWALPDPGQCLTNLMIGLRPLCEAHQLLAAIQPNGGIKMSNVSENLPPAPGAVTWVLGPQTPAANVQLARVAKHMSSVALNFFRAGLTSSVGGDCSTTELDVVDTNPIVEAALGAQTVREGLSNYFIEASNVVEEAIQKEVDGMVAYGDFQRANPSLTQGVDRGVLGSDLSRAAAVHALVGGGSGLQLAAAGGSTSPFRPVCTRPNLSPGGRYALDLMREAALRPSDVLSTSLSIQSLVNGGTSGCGPTSCGSVKQRLVLYGKDTSANSSTDVHVRFGLTMADFSEARDYLRDEFTAYRRYPGQMESNSLDVFPKFGGVAIPPLVPDRAFYRALASGTPLDPSQLIASSGIPWSSYDYSSLSEIPGLTSDISLATHLDLTLTHVQALLATPAATAPGYRALVAFAGEGYRRRPGRLSLAVSRAGCDPSTASWCATLNYYLAGAPVAQGYRIAIGDQTMECMTKGSLDGYACSLSSLTISNPNFGPVPNVGSVGFPGITNEWDPINGYRGFSVSTNTSLGGTFPGERVYVLKPRTPQANDNLLPPGEYETIGGGVIPPIPTVAGWTNANWATFPLIPELDQQVRDILAPSKAWCTQQDVPCSGGHFDERLPLENELTQDGSPSESSWKHYLDLARTAAAEADAIGSEMVQHGIELTSTVENQTVAERDRDEAQRVQVEQTLEELQNICGTSVDPRALLTGFSSDSQENKLDKEPMTSCSSDSSCTTANPNARCYSGRCILDPVKVAQSLVSDTNSTLANRSDAQRLVNCIGDDTVVDLVTIGKKSMCVWFPPGGTVPNSYCSTLGESGVAPASCPASPKDMPGGGDQCSGMSFPGTGYTTALVSETLGFFDNTNEGQADPGPIAKQCRSLAQLRRLVGGYTDPLDPPSFKTVADGAAQLIATNRLHVDSLKLIAPLLGWQPTIGGFSSITYNNETLFTTGSSGAAATTGWPCKPDARTGPQSTLFGSEPTQYLTSDCTDENYRAYINQRMRDAVLTAQATTTNAFANVAWPWDVGLEQGSQPGMTPPVSSNIGIAPGTPALPLFLDQLASGTPTVPNGATARTIPALSIYHATGAWHFWRFAGGSYFSYPGSTFYPASGASYPFRWTNKGKSYSLADSVPNFKPEMIWYGAGQDGRPDSRANEDWLAGQADPRSVFAYMMKGQAYGPSFAGVKLQYQRAYDDEALGSFRITPGSLWDAAELMCVASGNTVEPSGTITSGADVSKSALYLEQTANYVTNQAGRRVFAKFPKFAMDSVRKQGVAGAFPGLGGQMAEEVSRLRSNLVDIAGIAPKMASQLRLFAGDLKTFRAVLERNGLERDINTLEYTSQIANNLTECVKAVMDTVTIGIVTSPGLGGRAAATCANSIFQSTIADKIKDAKNQIIGLDDQIQFANFATNFETRSRAIKDLSDQALKLTEESDSHLAEIARLRQAARRSLDRALLMDSFSNKIHYHSNDAMRARFSTDSIRYEQHLEDAKRLSFVAKRAIEQRIGMHLSEMTFDMPLVDAPANWESQVCTLQGVKYADLVGDVGAGTEDSQFNYSSSYIGDYVDKLEKVVESYVLSSNFHEGHDTAVISLKDDVVKSHQSCEVPSRNLLTYTNDLSHLTSDSLTSPGWEIVGCATDTVEGVTTAKPECITVVPDRNLALTVENNSVPGFLIRRGPRCLNSAGLDSYSCGQSGSVVPDCPSGGCGLTAGARLRQRVSLAAGKYRISYYTRAKTIPELFGIGGLRVIVDADGSGTGASLADGLGFKPTFNGSAGAPETLSGYTRVFADFTLATPETVSVEIGMDRLYQLEQRMTVINPFQTQTLTGVMLENITHYAPSAAKPLSSPFAATGETLTAVDRNCPDTDGSAFRKKAFVRNCLSLCSNGFGDTCSEAGSRRECFWELNFPISQRLIESGRLLSSAGFAKGNFNYRLQDVAVNFVGTGIRDCTDQPGSCNGAGFVQYSLSHEGPFFVRNHFGGTFEAKLFDGNIEHARGLGVERYITNPISSSDSSLIQPYMHAELSGRPMDGNFVLRVWESPELDLSKITDVQVIMEYGYWTRFN